MRVCKKRWPWREVCRTVFGVTVVSLVMIVNFFIRLPVRSVERMRYIPRDTRAIFIV